MIIKNLRNSIASLLSLLTLSILSSSAWGTCIFQQLATSNVSFNNTIVQRDTPIGTTIASASVQPSASGSVMWCPSVEGGGHFYTQMDYSSQKTALEHVYATNVSGVGIRMVDSGGLYFDAPANDNTMSGYFNTGRWYTVDLIKTGPIEAGILSAGVVGSRYAENKTDAVIQINLISSTVSQAACTINTQNINIPLSDVLASDLTSVGSTAKPKTFNVGLDCDAGANINAKLTGIQNTDSSTDGVLQLTSAGNNNVASGVGIQILYNDAPIALNNNIVLKTSAGGQETFPFTAQYYQTKTGVTAGSANATATLELTYQ